MYDARLLTRSTFFSWQTAALLVFFFIIRAVSFGLAGHTIVQGILVFLLVMAFAAVYFRSPVWAWGIILAELFMGGSGHMFEFINLSIRTILIGSFLILWLLNHTGTRKLLDHIRVDKHIVFAMVLFGVYLIFSAFLGLYHGHDPRLIIQDVTPFAFFLLLFPLNQLIREYHARDILVRLLIVYILGMTIFGLVTFVLFSSGISELQDPFYKWFRDINVGKITDMGSGYFRIVESAHLLMVPLVLLIASLLMRPEKHHGMWRFLLLCGLIVLVLNFSRGYMLGLLAGLIVLKYKHSWKRWLIISGSTLAAFVLVFSTLHFAASSGTSFGLDLLAGRGASVVQPGEELSAATRMMILPGALEMIADKPILGEGLGASVTFTNTESLRVETTPEFDWGYLEMLAELGIVGTLLFLAIIGLAVWKLLLTIRRVPDYHDFHVGVLAGLASMLVINITAPALFHVFGIVLLVFIITVAIAPHGHFDHLINTLYRVFHRLKDDAVQGFRPQH